ncbi:MAG: GH32 C-terminal domain-containing protein, partial [Lachnospiraceae bacterium]|nr:GH32 C-terminal domain-containing protein [Lachnospiraceae bacterium]
NNTIMTDRGRVFVKNTGLKNRFYAPSYSDYYRLTIVVEPNVIEVYIDDGKYCITNTVYNLGHKLKGNIERLFISSENE